MEQFVDSVGAPMNEGAFETVVRGTPFETARPIQSKLSAIVFRKDGRVEDLGVICTRYVSTAFCTVVGNAMRGVSADVTRLQNYKYHAWGSTGTSTPENKTQSDLITPCSPTISPSFQPGSQVGSTVTYQTVATITADGSTGGSIAEHIVHCETGGSYGLDRSAFSPISVSSGDSIQFTYTLTIASDMP